MRGCVRKTICFLLIIVFIAATQSPLFGLATEAADNYTCYLQTDPQWSSHPYGKCTTNLGNAYPAYLGLTKTYDKETFYYGSGCSILSLVNTVAALASYNFSAGEITGIADYAVNNG